MIDLDKLEAIARAAPQGEWEVWTSNSWRRVMARGNGSTARVIEPITHTMDHWPDLIFGDGVRAYLEAMQPATILALIAEVRIALADAERYRWLRERAWYVDAATYALELRERWQLGDEPPPDVDDVEHALDAARTEGNRSPIDGNRSMISVPASHVICEVAGVTIIGSPDNVAAARAALEAAPLPAYPEELTPELREVLGWPNFKCAPVAHAFQASGYPIAKRAEDEQAFVLHWFTKLVLRHGGQWWEKACEEIASLAESARTRCMEAPNAD